jgi:hypothetical protein
VARWTWRAPTPRLSRSARALAHALRAGPGPVLGRFALRAQLASVVNAHLVPCCAATRDSPPREAIFSMRSTGHLRGLCDRWGTGCVHRG